MKQGLPDGHDSHGIAYCDISQYAIPEEKPGTYGLDIRLRIVLGIGPSPSRRYATYSRRPIRISICVERTRRCYTFEPILCVV